MDWIDTIVQGVLLGGLFALFATGLSLVFGVMRLVNLAHGDFIVLAAFLALAVVGGTGVSPLLALLIVAPLMFALGHAVQRGLLDHTLRGGVMPPLLVTFGLSIVIQNVLLQVFSADTRRLPAGGLETAGIEVGAGVTVGVLPLITFATAIAVIAALQVLFYRTRTGRTFRAASDRPEVVPLMGVDNRKVCALAMGIALAVCAVAGVLMALRTNVSPTIGPARLLYAFEAVIIGGLGSLWGTLAGGVILGVAQSVGAKLHPGMQILAGHLVFLAVLAVRPQGLFPRMRD